MPESKISQYHVAPDGNIYWVNDKDFRAILHPLSGAGAIFTETGPVVLLCNRCIISENVSRKGAIPDAVLKYDYFNYSIELN